MPGSHYKSYNYEHFNYVKIPHCGLGYDAALKPKQLTFDHFIHKKYKKDVLTDKVLCKILLKSQKRGDRLILNIYNSKLEQQIRDITKDYRNYTQSLKDEKVVF